MTETIENLILEHSKRLQGGQERIERDIREMKGRLSQLEIGNASIRGDIAHIAGDQARQQLSFDALAARVDRIERRLELTE